MTSFVCHVNTSGAGNCHWGQKHSVLLGLQGPAVYIQDCDRFQGPSSGGRHISDSREEQITSE